MLLGSELKDITLLMAHRTPPPAALAAAFEAAKEAWPGVELSRARYIEHLSSKLPADNPDPGALATADLYLACACADGDPQALRTFDHELSPVIERALALSGATLDERREVMQIVRTRLLVANGDRPPPIASYSGKGGLKSWVRVVATREAARLLAKYRREQPDDDALADAISPGDEPALGFLKRTYREEFKQAFHAAVAALADRERLLLRQAELDGLSIDELAAFYRVHRATTARWVQSAREAVLEGTRRQLAVRLGIDSGEVSSIMRLIRSNLDVSLPALLRSGRQPRKKRAR
jgi:RNA polymerase sigma-70 factor (ECF subfamily)